MIPLVEKAWELYQHTAHFSVETICTATAWLEERHRKTPCGKIAMHYLILALRHDAGVASQAAQEYCDRAAHWQAKACESSVVALAAKATEEN